MSAEEFKVILVGDSSVGKTSFLIRYAEGWFKDIHEGTVGVDCQKVQLIIDDTPVELIIWDTAGQERFKNIVNRFYRSADGVIIMYDVTKKSTFDNVPWWVEDVRNHCENIPIVLVGNKCEESRNVEVLEELAQDFAEENHLLYFLSSAKNNVNVLQVFESLASKMLTERETNFPDGEGVRLWPTDYFQGNPFISNIRLEEDTHKNYFCCFSCEKKPSGLIV